MTGQPRLLIGGVSSGVGKTTFTVGLCRALMRRGLAVSVFKCGPDYLDPTYHRNASGRSVENLDGWLMGNAALRRTFMRAAADVSLIEGVMGLFDGVSPTELTGSSAEVAAWLEAPVVLVCDASGMARSVAALAHGFASFEPGLRVAGVICNRVGSGGHLELLRRAASQPPVLGGLLRGGAPSFPERHLGLWTARELELEPVLEAWADQVERHCDVDALLAIARSAPPLEASAVAASPLRSGAPPPRCRIAVADDDAFHFYYEDNLRQLEAAGAELVRFSPLNDAALHDVDGVYIGGGYPELYAAALSGNTGMSASLRALAAAGAPIYAECGGLMYLSSGIVTLDGRRHAMVGLIEGWAIMRDRLQALGYVEVETRLPTLLGPQGVRFRGHQFRYSGLDAPSRAVAYRMSRPSSGTSSDEGYIAGSVLASYVHAHWAESPEVPIAFVARCREWRAAARADIAIDQARVRR